MRIRASRLTWISICSVLALTSANGTTRYVSPAGLHVAPYTNWQIAATDIQSAVDASVAGDWVLVTNGVYAVGGRVVSGTLTNRLLIDKPLTVTSVGGPQSTFIVGAPSANGGNGDGAVRCVYITNAAWLCGFTLTNGHTRSLGNAITERSGGGAWIAGGYLSNCVIAGSSSSYLGGGVYSGSLQRCAIEGNLSLFGAGAAFSTVVNCSFSGNRADWHGGAAYGCRLLNSFAFGNRAKRGGGSYASSVRGCTLVNNGATSQGGGSYGDSVVNSIVFYNSANLAGADYFASTLASSCAYPAAAVGHNTAADPLLASLREPRILPASPCMDAGDNAYTSGVDIDDTTRPADTQADIGCDDVPATNRNGSLRVTVHAPWTNLVMGSSIPLEADVRGTVIGFVWSFGDDSIESNTVLTSHTFVNTGSYRVVLSAWNESGVFSATTMLQVVQNATYHVSPSGAAIPPYTNPASAARTIQEAVDAVPADLYGAEVLVGEGLYNTGYRKTFGYLYARLCIDKPVRVRAAAGPVSTFIEGNADPVSASDGYQAARCVVMHNHSSLSGFTIRKGHTYPYNTTYDDEDMNGGGVWCQSINCLVSNCVIEANSAALYGGGTRMGTLIDCVLVTNRAKYGGGTYGSTLVDCKVASNAAVDVWNNDDGWGGGLYGVTAEGCLITCNTGAAGAGARDSFLRNCTVADNLGLDGAGVFGCVVRNSIVYGNTSTDTPSNQNYAGVCSFVSSCTYPRAAGHGNLDANPEFVANGIGNYRLRSHSPCIDAGWSESSTRGSHDLAGGPRVFNGSIDIGAFEFAVQTRVRAFLEGAYVSGTGEMTTHLADAGLLPTQAPFCADPRLALTIPAQVVDWVLVQLVNTNNLPQCSRSLFLRKDGYVCDETGSTNLYLDVAAGSSYRLALRHRNHLAIVSSASLPYTNTHAYFNFIDSPSMYQGGSNGCVRLDDARYAMAGGDIDGDGAIGAADLWFVTNTTSDTGYQLADVNLDGSLSAADSVRVLTHVGLTGALSDAPSVCPQLDVSPQFLTVRPAATVLLAAPNAAASVSWLLAAASPGATIAKVSPTSALYTAGTVTNATDIVEAWDGRAFGRFQSSIVGAAQTTDAGLSLVVAGRKDSSDSLWPATRYLADLAYQTLRFRGYPKSAIRYLSPTTSRDVDGNGITDDIYGQCTTTQVATAITNWAAAAGRLFLYLVDHGADSEGKGYLRLDSNQTLAAADLDRWLDQLQDRSGANVVVLIDCCHAESLLDELSYSGTPTRVVIAAAATNQAAYFLAGGLVSFSESFINGILLGKNLADCYSAASESISSYQRPAYWDNGGGSIATGLLLGPGSSPARNVPRIGQVCGRQALDGKGRALLWASDIESSRPITRVWCCVVPPNHTIRDPSRPVDDVPRVDLVYDTNARRYELSYDGFVEQGTYKIVYYAEAEGGSVSFPRQSYVLQREFDERVILAAGDGDNTASSATIAGMARTAYTVLRARGIPKTSICYLSNIPVQDVDADGTNDVSGPCTANMLKYAITEWASWTNQGPADKLDLCLVGTVDREMFRLKWGQDPLKAKHLNAWLGTFQSASNSSAVVVMDFSSSGSTADTLKDMSNKSRPRLVVASSAAQRRSPRESSGRMSFWNIFWGRILLGEPVGAAFKMADEQIQDIGDAEEDEDEREGKLWSREMRPNTTFLGSAFLTGADAPRIGRTMPLTYAVSNTVALWAADLFDLDGISNVWMGVSHSADESTFETNLPWAPDTVNRISCFYDGFSATGKYIVSFIASDRHGDLSPMAFSRIVRLDLPPARDSDGDGVLNSDETLAGTDPRDPSSVLRLSSSVVSPTRDSFTFRWQTVSNLRYSVESTTNLLGRWQTLISDLDGKGEVLSYGEPSFGSFGKMFYRVTTE